MGQRIVTGVVGIAIAAFVIQTGGYLFAAFGLLLMLIGYHEYVKAFSNIDIRPTLVGGMAALLLLWGAGCFGTPVCVVGSMTLATLAIMSGAVFRHGVFTVPAALVSVAGVAYLGLTLPCLIFIRNMGDGALTPAENTELGCALIWLTFAGTWASDTFAYFAGSFFGKHKLCPAVSPKKTVEGFIGGLVGTVFTVAAIGSYFGFATVPLAVMGFFQCLVATLGDLVESIIKRYTGIKDSGNIIPGHGGVLDRFDSVIFTAPFVYYFVQLVPLIK